MEQAIVGADSESAEAQGAFVQRGERAEGHVALSGSAGQVAGHGFEVVALGERAVDAVRRHVQHILVVAAQVDRGLPIPAERRLTEGVLRVQEGAVAGLLVGAGIPAELGAGVRLVVAGVDLDLHAVSAVEPVVGVVAGLVPTRTGFVAAGPRQVPLSCNPP